MDTNIQNYNIDELIDLIQLPKKKQYTLDDIQQGVSKCMQQLTKMNTEPKSLLVIGDFLINGFRKLCDAHNILYSESNIQTLESQKTLLLPKLEKADTIFEGSHAVIQHDNTDSAYLNVFNNTIKEGVINPFKKQTTPLLLNINTKFRANYFTTKSTDFIYSLPNSLKNVVSMKFVSGEIPNCLYTFSAALQTNEFTIQSYDLDGTDYINETEQVIKIREGYYTGDTLADYLNKFVFILDNSLNHVACEAHSSTCKFRFFYDARDISNGGAGPLGDGGIEHQFNIDFRLQENKTRAIQLNMGWILGYKQPYYSWDKNYVPQDTTSYNMFEGYNPEGIYDSQPTKYFLLSVDEYNNNYTTNIIAPFQEGMMKNNGLLAKIQNVSNESNIIFESSADAINKRREYFGPVNINKLHIQLMDDMGRIVDLQNSDYSISLQLNMLYDL